MERAHNQLFTTIYLVPDIPFSSFIAYLFWKYAINNYLCTKFKKDQWWIKHYNYITLLFFLQEYQFSVSPVACMCIGSVDSSKFPNYFFTGTTCWLVLLVTAVFLSDFQADVTSSLKILLCVVNHQFNLTQNIYNYVLYYIYHVFRNRHRLCIA